MRRSDVALMALALVAAALLFTAGGQPVAADTRAPASSGAATPPPFPTATGTARTSAGSALTPLDSHEPTRTPTVTRTPTLSPTPTFTPTVTTSPTPSVTPTPGTLPGVRLRLPANRATLPGVGPAALTWDLPSGATQYQLQVLPGNGDGPGLNLIRGAESGYSIPAPVLGEGPYILLPGMRYIWRVRATDKSDFAPENDRAWGPWSEIWAFTTAAPSSASLSLVTPAEGSTVGTAATQVVWKNTVASIFYYEIQMSGDTRFDPDPGTATSFVWWNLVHSGVTDPPNSWRTPPLQPAATYYWRVRPRVQGDAPPAAWGPVWRFQTPGTLTPATPTPTPTQTPAPGARIAFVSQRDGVPDLYAMNADGAGVTRLTSGLQVDGLPVWSKDATRLAFVSVRESNREIYVVNADGARLTNLSNDSASDAQPVWSVDNGRLAWVSQREGNNEIYVLFFNTDDTTTSSRLTNSGASDEQPAWAPNNGYIAFVTTRDGPKEIYLMGTSGGGQTRLTNTKFGVNNDAPLWSPDGSKLLFVTDRDGNREFYTVDPYKLADDQTPVRLTNNLWNEHSAAWSPDGRRIAFVSDRDGNPEIYVMDADGNNQVRLTTNTSVDAEPFWSPDGRRIVFASNRAGSNDIFVMNADGAAQTNLTVNGAADMHPVWAPK